MSAKWIIVDKVASTILIILSVILCTSVAMLSICINTQRTSDFNTRRSIMAEIQKTPETEDKKKAIDDLQIKLFNVAGDINYGEHSKITTCDGIAAYSRPFNPDCYYAKSNENNNVQLSIMIGILTSCAMAAYWFIKNNVNTLPASYCVSLILYFSYGAVSGLIGLGFLRGAKGTLASPITEIVQADSPYGIVVVSSLFVLFTSEIYRKIHDKFLKA